MGIPFWSWDFEVGPGVVRVPRWVLGVDSARRGIPFRVVCMYATAQRWGRLDCLQVLGLLLYTNKDLVVGGNFNIKGAESAGTAGRGRVEGCGDRWGWGPWGGDMEEW